MVSQRLAPRKATLAAKESDNEDSSVEAERGNVDGSSSDPNLETVDIGDLWDVTASFSQVSISTLFMYIR